MSWMGGRRKETNPGGSYHGSYRCLVDDDQGIPLMEQRRLGHHIVCSPQASEWISSRGVVPSETNSQRKIDESKDESNARSTKT
jgi:hypothetical protein